jgi:DNA-binding GntR family transcriptional regulator
VSNNPFSFGIADTVDDLARVNAHVPASALVYSEVRSRIISLLLPPQTTLSRAELAEQFNVSQSPVREAILRLEQDGLVVSYPQSRTEVTKIDVVRIREEHFLRIATECEVVRQLSMLQPSAAMAKAKGFIKMQEALVDDVEQATMFRQLDEAFHAALFAGVGQSNLHAHVTARCGNLARVRSLDLPRAVKMESVLKGHKAAIEMIEAGDGEAAARAMREHLSGTMERLPEIIKENRPLFT